MSRRTQKIGDETYTGFSREDLGDGKCGVCDKPAPRNGIDFYVLKFERFLLNHQAIQRQAGLEMQMGGGRQGAMLANAVGPDSDLAAGLGQHRILVCSDCGLSGKLNLAVIAESLNEEG